MRLMVSGLFVGFLASFPPMPAFAGSDAPFCLHGNSGIPQCDYYTVQSCQAAAARFNAVCSPNTAATADNGSGARNAGAALGEILFGGKRRSQAAYEDEKRRIMEPRLAQQRAAADQAEAELAAVEEETRGNLEDIWQALGLDAEESKAVASAYKLDESQAAINARAKREGWESARDAAIRAYKDYNYQLANQLLVASFRAHVASQAESQPEPSP